MLFTNLPLTAVVVDSDLKVAGQAKVDFDADFGVKYGIRKGVHVRESTGEVFAPVALWMESLDLVLDRLAQTMTVPVSRIRAVSGSCQQHGSVFWNDKAADVLRRLDPDTPLVDQLPQTLAHEWSPNWQDQSTQEQCDAFDAALGGRQKLAEVTGSGAHHVSQTTTTNNTAFYRYQLLTATPSALHGYPNHAIKERSP
jgi:xylulokinase